MSEINSYGQTKDSFDRAYPNRPRKGIKKEMNKHLHWLTNNRFCKVCGKQITYSFMEEIEKDLYGLQKV